MADTSLQRLREHLFDTIERLKDINNPETSKEDQINLESAKRICDISSKIIESAKVELEAMKVIHGVDDFKGNEIIKSSPLFQLQENN